MMLYITFTIFRISNYYLANSSPMSGLVSLAKILKMFLKASDPITGGGALFKSL